MSYYINSDIGYYEGDLISSDDLQVPQRPDPWASWDGEKWVAGSPPKEPTPMEKLKAFLVANPDVAAAIG